MRGAGPDRRLCAVTSRQFALSQLTLLATASSGLADSFSTAAPKVCSAAGSTSPLLTAGTCVVHASQAGDSAYAAASTTQGLAVKAAEGADGPIKAWQTADT